MRRVTAEVKRVEGVSVEVSVELGEFGSDAVVDGRTPSFNGEGGRRS